MRTLTLGPQVVWSDGATTLWHPMMSGVPTTDVVSVRVHIELRTKTANAKIRVAAQSSDDGVNWTDAQVVLNSTWTTTNGVTYSTSWVTLSTAYQTASATLRAFIRLGVECGGANAGQNELGVASLRVDVRSS